MEGANYFYIDFNFSIWSVSVSCIVLPREMFAALLPIRCCCCCSYCCHRQRRCHYSIEFFCVSGVVCVCVFFCVLLVWTSSLMMRCSFDGKVFHFDMILCIIQSNFLAQILLIFSCVRKSFQVNWFKCFILFAVPAKRKYVRHSLQGFIEIQFVIF